MGICRSMGGKAICPTVRNIRGSGGPPPEKFWNLDPLRLILTQYESQIKSTPPSMTTAI